MKVKLTLDGSRDDVMSVVALALEANVLDAMERVDETAGLADLPNQHKTRLKSEYVREFIVGRRVVVKYQRTDRPYVPEVGKEGTVQNCKFSGRGAVVIVKFDGIKEPIGVPSSMLEAL